MWFEILKRDCPKCGGEYEPIRVKKPDGSEKEGCYGCYLKGKWKP